MKRPLAVVTMVYNEADLLPVWLRHYAREVGAENCFVLDHGSDDGSTDAIAASVIRLPRSPFNEWERAHAVRDFCASLFFSFRHVLYADADELVVVEPDQGLTLSAYVGANELPPVLDLFGGDVLHSAEEADLDLTRSISEQRRYMRPISTLSKPTLVSRRLDWHIGFHCLIQDHRPNFSDLFLFHVAHCDSDILYRRQAKRNAAAPAGITGSHHTIPPGDFRDAMRTEVARLPRRSVEMREGEPYFEETKTLFSDAIERKDWAQAPDLWRIPDRFVGAF